MAFKRVDKVLQKAKNYFREKFNARPTFAVYAPETANIFGGFIYGFDNQGFIYCTVSSKIFCVILSNAGKRKCLVSPQACITINPY